MREKDYSHLYERLANVSNTLIILIVFPLNYCVCFPEIRNTNVYKQIVYK